MLWSLLSAVVNLAVVALTPFVRKIAEHLANVRLAGPATA
jgi:hypothetical protein